MADTQTALLDDLDRSIINVLQDGFPIGPHPYAQVAGELDTDETTLLERLQRLLDRRILTRFGPMYHAQHMGGAFSLVAMRVPPDDLDRVVEIVNGFDEVAHNYEREHAFNLWFVLATETPDVIGQVLAHIEHATGHRCYNMPKLEEFFVRLRVPV
ncbi:Heme d1 biosynthesis protein NirG [Thioalkalivibrio nitratireducens DSM 14787]|uniref:siroheme decarboxylase n=1 Tax=Thioalkalivibrio nitratireducens (strain DSM 14787 / UNIQEM 213 / ALEN2) TaxID=1255043 RepID=L0DWB6_THIND|nr:AsnC family transcriptional regulator [Thioalkalivibrio nitratireducens]AGA33312.1 Heme d1 biosynthesis protein NirG [Thioalkalivibrio nitratireducens DSM 14787]